MNLFLLQMLATRRCIPKMTQKLILLPKRLCFVSKYGYPKLLDNVILDMFLLLLKLTCLSMVFRKLLHTKSYKTKGLFFLCQCPFKYVLITNAELILCIVIMFIFFTRQAKDTTGQVDDSKDILTGRHDPSALKVSGLHCLFFSVIIFQVHCICRFRTSLYVNGNMFVMHIFCFLAVCIRNIFSGWQLIIELKWSANVGNWLITTTVGSFFPAICFFPSNL